MSLPVSMLSNTPLLSNAKSKPSNQDNILPIFHPFGAFKRIWDPILIIVLIISVKKSIYIWFTTILLDRKAKTSMGNHPTLDCNKHNNQAKKCKQLKEVYKIDSQCSHNVNHKQPKFDSTYDKIKKCQTKINHYLNACNHVMRHHNDDLLNGHLNELHKHNCDLNKCMMLRRNYRENKFSDKVILKYINDTQRTKHNDDIRQMLFFQAVESMHEYLCHNKNDKKYFIQKRNLIKQLSPAYYNNLTSRYVGINNQNEFEEKFTPHTKENKKHINGGYESESISISTTSLSMFSSKSCKSVHSQSKNVKKYENGRQWIYKTDKKHKKSYVGCHYINLQQELHEECRLSKRVWKGFIMKSKQLQETHEVKRIRHRINMDKSLSTIRVLILFIYTSYEKFQKRLNELARVTCNLNKMDERKAKKQHSKLGHSFKMLIETVQNYGLINNNLNSISIVYRGLSIIPLFSKYLLTCHSPCSTSRSYPAAVTFAGLDNNAAAGSVLELSVPNGSIYFDMQFISIYKLEFELLFYGLNSFLCMEQLYIEYICKNKINLTPMILLEKITGASYPIKYTNEYKESENILNELLNNEYKEEKKQDNCMDIHLPKTQFMEQDYYEILNGMGAMLDGYNCIHIVHISDTHELYAKFNDEIPFKKDAINILIHSGDFSPEDGPIKRKRNGSKGMIPKIKQFAQWFKALPHQKKIIIAGNHEHALIGLTKEEIQTDIFGNDDSVIYLQDDMINLYGINIYGTPWNEREYMAFGADNDGMKEKWKLIPKDTDILITHQPPYNEEILCKVTSGGNQDLWNEVVNRIKPKVHLFGHFHAYNGYVKCNDVLFINSSLKPPTERETPCIPHEFEVIFDS
eukprot:147463_1